MRNLIEQSKQKSTRCATKINDVFVADYESVIVRKQVGEKRYCWHIQRALEGHFTKHFICCEVISNHLESRKARLYSDVTKFESAIKRIEKQVN